MSIFVLILLAFLLVFIDIGPCMEQAPLLSSGESNPIGSPQGGQRLRTGEYTRHLEVNGLDRTYLLHIPIGLDPDNPAPVILSFHPGFGTARGFARITKLSERAGVAGFIVVYPEGYRRSWNAGDCCGPAKREGINDVAFVRAVLSDLTSVVNVDPRRIFATGFSNGAKMAYLLACQLSDRVAAIGPSGAAISVPDSACVPTRPVPVLHFHGLADEYGPFSGGPSKREQAGVQRSIPETISLWVQRNGCTNETRVTYQRGAARCVTHPNCRDGAEITLCTIAGMGHQWPGGEVVFPKIYGPGTKDISATDMLVTFFRDHPMPVER